MIFSAVRFANLIYLVNLDDSDLFDAQSIMIHLAHHQHAPYMAKALSRPSFYAFLNL
jgi:hypothetical protein